MRIVGEIPHPSCKITIFSWNNRYLIKLEKNHLEQTFKIDQFDITHENDLYKVIDDTFIQQTVQRFSEMAVSLKEAMQRV
mgnify:CR=1 FL=1